MRTLQGCIVRPLGSHLTGHELIKRVGFSPKMVFEAIYYRSCLKSLLDYHKDQSMTDERAEEQAEEQARYLRKRLIDAFLNMTLSGKSAAHLHREKAGSVGILFKSNTTCLGCLRRMPECPLSCGHSICETCVRIFGEEMPIMECQYYIGTCLLGHSGNCTVRLKPFSAGERILSIDGGGPRGVIPLEILKIIQDIMGPDTRLQDMFDVAFGTSVGRFASRLLEVLNLTMRQEALLSASCFCAVCQSLNVLNFSTH